MQQNVYLAQFYMVDIASKLTIVKIIHNMQNVLAAKMGITLIKYMNAHRAIILTGCKFLLHYGSKIQQ